MGMLHDEPVRRDDDGDGAGKAWTGEKRRRNLPPPSSDDAPSTSQDPSCRGSAQYHHPDPITHNATDMAGTFQGQGLDRKLLPATSDLRQAEEEEGQELFGPGVILSKEDQDNYAQILLPNIRPPINLLPSMSTSDNFKIQARQGRCRVAYYKAMKPESGCELEDPDACSDDEIGDQQYFKYLQDDECFEWFFHTDDSWIADLGDYQRIALRNYLPGRTEPEYRDVNDYRELYHTYEMDAVYVKYYGEITKKIKWTEDFLHMDTRSAEWRDMETRGWRQALKIATQLPHMTSDLAGLAYDEYIWELREDASHKDLDLVYFEIWRLVVKDNRKYMDAVKEVHAMEKYHMHKRTMAAELTGSPVFFSIRQRINWIVRERGIDLNTEDNKAQDLFRKEIDRLKLKNMAKYAEKKMEIGERLNLHKRIEVSGRVEVP